jgi:hypothetical protein
MDDQRLEFMIYNIHIPVYEMIKKKACITKYVNKWTSHIYKYMYIKKNVNNFIDNNGRLECENNKWMENPMKNTTHSINSAFHLGRFKKVIGNTVKGHRRRPENLPFMSSCRGGSSISS